MTPAAATQRTRATAAPKMVSRLVPGVDHVGLSIADLDQSLSDISTLFGVGACYIEGPILEKTLGWMTRKLGAEHGGFSLRVAAVNLFGLNVELFDYAPLSRQRTRSASDQHDLCVILIRIPQPEHLLNLVPEGSRVQTCPDTGTCVVTLPGGLEIMLQSHPSKESLPVFVLGSSRYAVMHRRLTEEFGMTIAGPLSTSIGQGTILQGMAGARVALLLDQNRHLPPCNSDTGGHHLAFHANDVDRAAQILCDKGYSVMGTPETITEGPIAGDRWVYVTSPEGFQLELINMPDGTMPYEQTSNYHRKPI